MQHVCPTCGKSFSRKGDLTRHRRGIHAGERPHVCRVCYKAFSQASGLKTHKNIHTGEKPFVCNLDGCTKAFSDPSSCARHRKEIHRGVESYKCPVSGCTSRIKRRSAFACHLRKHGLDTNNVDLEKYTSRKRGSKAKPSAEPKKTVKEEPRYFTPQPLPAYHGALHGESSSTYSNLMPYANHDPYNDSHNNSASLYMNSLPNNLYSTAPSRSASRTPELATCFSSPGSNRSICHTPEPLNPHSNPVDIQIFHDTGDAAKMFMAPFDNDLWQFSGGGHMYQGPYPYTPQR